MPDSKGIPSLPDLTHPSELIQFGSQLISTFLTLALLVGLLGVIIALLSFALKRDQPEQAIFVGEWVVRYSFLLRVLQHIGLVTVLVISGFLLCSTLGNRYHNWEQARVAQITSSVAGDRLEQSAPQIRYEIDEPYTYDTQVDGKVVQVQKVRKLNRFLTLTGSQIQVKLDQATDAQNRRAVYRADFSADYQVKNPLSDGKDFFFEIPTPIGYSLLQGFKVEQNGTRLDPINPGDYGFPFRLDPGAETRFRVTYQVQGGPRWVYNAGGQLLSNFRLTVQTSFPQADFASSIVPTESKVIGQGTQFTWVFNDNVSVQNPFGVFTSVGPILNTGILPRLLLLAPAIFIWWLFLLYLSLPISLRNVTIAGGVFFACLLALTYLSRVIDVKVAWLGVGLILMSLSWGLGTNRSASLAALICTIAGAIVPVYGLLTPYTGLTLSFAGLLSVAWLAVRNWYGWYRINPQS